MVLMLGVKSTIQTTAGNAMHHTNNQIIKHKVGLLNLAEELKNVSKACEVIGVSISSAMVRMD